MNEQGAPGERGPQGDHGQTGDSGETGRDGQTGPTGAGERGATGDTGQPGRTGDTGKDGMIGLTGLTGIGERGMTGDHGQVGAQGQPGVNAPPVLSRIVTLVLFLFVTFAFSVVAYRSEVNDRNIRAAVVAACERSNDNSESINTFLDLLIANARISAVLTPAEVRQRVAGYESQKVTLLRCK